MKNLTITLLIFCCLLLVTNEIPKDGLCPVLNMKMDWGGERKGSRTSPSLDKIEPSLGYVKGNVMWMSQRANSMKQDSSTEELKSFAKWIKKTIK